MPEVPCSWYVNPTLAGLWGQEVCRVRGLRDLAVEFHVFMFLTLRANTPQTSKECRPDVFLLCFCSFFGRVVSACAQKCKRRRKHPSRTSGPHLCSKPYQYKCQRHVFPLCLPLRLPCKHRRGCRRGDGVHLANPRSTRCAEGGGGWNLTEKAEKWTHSIDLRLQGNCLLIRHK